MKKFLFLSFFSLLTGIGFSQVGITAGVQFIQAMEWEEHLQTTYNNSNLTFFSPTVALSLDYWFRLKNKRIEFMPEIGFANYSTSFDPNLDPVLNERHTYENDYYSFYFNTNIYPLDFGGDCNCPTFNKDGDLIKKGFFIRLAPGVVYNKHTQTILGSAANVSNSAISQDDNYNFSFRAGVGLDIGISPFLTLTPLLMGIYNTPSTWMLSGPELPSPEPAVAVESQVMQLFAGIRLGFRFDELNKYGYR